MSYTPINPYVYEAAYAGALAGMNASAYALQSNATTYAMNAAIAGAWAQEFDTVWNSATTLNQLQFDAIRSLSETNWYDRTPQALIYTDWASNGNTSALTPATYLPTVTALIGVINAGSLYFTAQGITPPAVGSGNATSLLGVPILSATAGISNMLLNNGVSWYAKKEEVWLDSFFAQYGGADDGVTDCSAAINAWIAACKGRKGRVSKPAVAYAFYSKITGYDDTASGNLNHVQLQGDDGWNTNGTQACWFKSRIPNKIGYAASITDYRNGGSGKFSQLFDLGPGSGILAADAAQHIGEWFNVWNTANPANAGPMGMICVGVPADNQILLSNQNTGAAATDANNSSICWEKVIVGWDIRMRDFVMEGFTIAADTGFTLHVVLQQTFSPNPGAQQVIRNRVANSSFIMQASNAKIVDGIWVARSIVPIAGNSLYGGLNGAGDLQEQFPFQVDTMDYENLLIGSNSIAQTRFSIAFFSRTGQSKENSIRRLITSFNRMGVGVPRTRYNGTVWSVDGNPQFSVFEGSFGATDTWFRHGSTSSGACNFMFNYGESGSRIYEDDHGLLPQVANFFGNVPTIQPSSIYGGQFAIHPSGELYTLNGAGPYNFFGGFDTVTGGSATPAHISIRGEPTASQTKLNFFGQTFYENPGWNRKPRITGNAPGPARLNGTEVVTVTTNPGAVTNSVTLSQANFDAVFGAGIVSLLKAEYYQIAAVVQKFCTNVTSWGSPENTDFNIQGVNGGVTGNLQITSAPASLGLSGALTAGQNSTQIGTDSSNIVEVALASGGVTKVTIGNYGSQCVQQSTLANLPFFNFAGVKSYSATIAPTKQSVNGVMGISGKQDGVPINNLNGSVDLTAAATTVSVVFGTAEPAGNGYMPMCSPQKKSGAPAAGAYRYHIENVTTAGFDIVTEAAPGGAGDTVTYNWWISR